MTKLIITIELPQGALVETRLVDTSGPEDIATPSTDDDQPIASAGRRMIDANAPARDAKLQVIFFKQCLERFGIEGTPPSTGSRTYLNFLPPKRYGSSRVASMETRSGRVVVACDLANVTHFDETRVAEGKYVEVKLITPDNVETALALVLAALTERGWTGFGLHGGEF